MSAKRNRAQEVVGAHVQEHGDSGSDKEQQHFHERAAHDDENYENEDETGKDSCADSPHHKIFPVNLHHGLVSVMLKDALLDGLGVRFAGDIEPVQGKVVLFAYGIQLEVPCEGVQNGRGVRAEVCVREHDAQQPHVLVKERK